MRLNDFIRLYRIRLVAEPLRHTKQAEDVLEPMLAAAVPPDAKLYYHSCTFYMKDDRKRAMRLLYPSMSKYSIKFVQEEGKTVAKSVLSTRKVLYYVAVSCAFYELAKRDGEYAHDVWAGFYFDPIGEDAPPTPPSDVVAAMYDNAKQQAEELRDFLEGSRSATAYRYKALLFEVDEVFRTVHAAVE